MNALYALFAVVSLVLFVFLGVSAAHLQVAFGVIVPYAAVSVFLVGVVYRVLKWASVPVPFRITTVCGQQKSLPWIKNSTLESPPNAVFTAVRMALEILAFRSLFRNTRVVLADENQHPGGKRNVYSTNLLLWLGALAFHYCFLVILGENADGAARRQWLADIVAADRDAGSARSDRSRYLAALATLELTGADRDAFRSIALVAPLKQSLAAKKSAMERALAGYQSAAGYAVSRSDDAGRLRDGWNCTASSPRT